MSRENTLPTVPDDPPSGDPIADRQALDTLVRLAGDPEPPIRVTMFGPVRGSVAFDDPVLAARIAWAVTQVGSTIVVNGNAQPRADLTEIVRQRVIHHELPAWVRLFLRRGGAR